MGGGFSFYLKLPPSTTSVIKHQHAPKKRLHSFGREKSRGRQGGSGVYDQRLKPNVQTVAPISNLRPSIKEQCSNRGGEPSARCSPALLCSHVSENKPIRGHTLPVSGTDQQLQADCLNRSSWWLSDGTRGLAVKKKRCRVWILGRIWAKTAKKQHRPFMAAKWTESWGCALSSGLCR